MARRRPDHDRGERRLGRGATGRLRPDGATRTLPWDCGHVSALVAAPVGNVVAFANHRNEVWIGDVASGALSAVDTSGYGRSDDLAWSPDGAWLAYTFHADTRHVAIKLFERASGNVDAGSPSPSSATRRRRSIPKDAISTSSRCAPSIRSTTTSASTSASRAARGPYLIALQAGGAPPFDPAPRGSARSGAAAEEKAGAAAKTPPAPLRIDLDGIARRVAAFPVAEDRYGRIAGVAGAKVVWTTQNIVGAHGRGGHKEAAGKLERFDFATGRSDTLVEKVDDFALAADAVTLIYREARTCARSPPTGRPSAGPSPARAKGRRRARTAGSTSIAFASRSSRGANGRRCCARSGACSATSSGRRSSRESTGTRSGASTRRCSTRLATRADLSDLVWEMQGELGTSHAYEMGGDYRKPPAVALGHLACESRWDAARGGFEITAIARGDAWDASADSPLNAIGVEAKVGDVIVAVGGEALAPSRPPEALLVNRAGQKVELTLARGGAGGTTSRREVVATALADDVPVYYRDWVESNRAWVHERSAGRVGYFHVPDMQAAGFAEFHRYFGSECERDALIVDVRYNRGGHVSQLLLEKVARKRIAFVHSRWMNVTHLSRGSGRRRGGRRSPTSTPAPTATSSRTTSS